MKKTENKTSRAAVTRSKSERPKTCGFHRLL